MKAEPFTKLGHRPALDGIRGIAILAVLGVHTNHIFGWSILPGGNIGVDIFFVLSGFLITSLLLAEIHEKATVSFKKFYARRALRLVPALVAMLVAVALTASSLYSKEEGLESIAAIPLAFLYVTDFAIAFFETPLGVLRHTWSLSIEEQFYLLWPACLLALGFVKERSSRIWLMIFAVLGFGGLRALLWYQGASVSRMYYNIDTRADALLMGCLAGMLFSWGILENDRVRMILRVLAFPSVLVLGIGIVATDFATPFLYVGGLTVFAAAAAILILSSLVTAESAISIPFRWPWLAFIGKISYGLYLWHYPVFKAVRYLGAEWYLQLAAAIAATFGISLLSYRFVEQPFLRIKRRFATASESAIT